MKYWQGSLGLKEADLFRPVASPTPMTFSAARWPRLTLRIAYQQWYAARHAECSAVMNALECKAPEPRSVRGLRGAAGGHHDNGDQEQQHDRSGAQRARSAVLLVMMSRTTATTA